MMLQLNKNICLVAGKSAGHILPALTIAQKMKRQNSALTISFISNQTALDYQAINQNQLISNHLGLALMNVPYQRFWLWPKFGWQLLSAIYRIYRIFKTNRPSQIISTGGLIAIPACLVGKYLKIPIIIHELNVTPGKATQFLAKLADEIRVCFTQTTKFLPSSKCLLDAYPNRFDSKDYQITKAQALSVVQKQNSLFQADYKTILILGGSQGSLFINQAFAKVVARLKLEKPNFKFQIIHQTGQNDQTNWSDFYAQNQIAALVFDYSHDLMPYYRLSDLIICRSGAGTLAEILPLNSPCLTIPLETSYTSHQLENALALENSNHNIKVLRQSKIEQDKDCFYELVMNMLN